MNRTMRKTGYIVFVLVVALASYAACIKNARVALAPYTWMLHWMYGLSFAYAPETGYVCETYHFAITQSCMGAKLFVAAFLILCLGFPRTHANARGRLARVFVYYIGSLLGAFVLNMMRIAVSLPFVGLGSGQLIHNLISLAMYFGALLSLYVAMQRRKLNESQ